MKIYHLLIICLSLHLIVSCRQNIKWENVTIKNGVYVNETDGEKLDGKFISDDKSEENVILFEYSNGIPVGEWSDTHRGDLIHSGKYLEEEDTKITIQRFTKCKRVDLDFWKEADYQFLTLELIEPTTVDTLTLKKVIEITKRSLLNKYKFKTILIDSIGLTDKNYIYEKDIK